MCDVRISVSFKKIKMKHSTIKVKITPTYKQIIVPETLKFGPIDPKNYDVFVVKSRVHFRRGFDETGYAKTIFVVDAPGDWFGTIRLDALDYKYGPIKKLFPFDGGTIEY